MVGTSRSVTRGALLLLAAACPLAALAQLDAAAPLADDPTVIALAVALACSDPPEGAAAAPGPPSGPAAVAPVELVATVRARTLAFDEVPRAGAVLPAGAGAEVTWRAERLNLPLRPRAGVVYRDVEVRLTISGTQDALAAMLGQARLVASGIRIEEGAAARPPPQASTATSTPIPISTATSTATPN